MNIIFNEDEFYTIREIAKILKISTDGVRRLIAKMNVRIKKIGYGPKGRIRVLGSEAMKLFRDEDTSFITKMDEKNVHLMKSAWRACPSFEDYLDKIRKSKLN